jgi:hypothetical protein
MKTKLWGFVMTWAVIVCLPAGIVRAEGKSVSVRGDGFTSLDLSMSSKDVTLSSDISGMLGLREAYTYNSPTSSLSKDGSYTLGLEPKTGAGLAGNASEVASRGESEARGIVEDGFFGFGDQNWKRHWVLGKVTPLPETPTLVAAGLLLLPFAGGALRLRKFVSQR